MAVEGNGHSFDVASSFASPQEFKFWSPFIDKVTADAGIVPDSPDHQVVVNAVASFSKTVSNGAPLSNFLMVFFNRYLAQARVQMQEVSLKQ